MIWGGGRVARLLLCPLGDNLVGFDCNTLCSGGSFGWD